MTAHRGTYPISYNWIFSIRFCKEGSGSLQTYLEEASRPTCAIPEEALTLKLTYKRKGVGQAPGPDFFEFASFLRRRHFSLLALDQVKDQGSEHCKTWGPLRIQNTMGISQYFLYCNFHIHPSYSSVLYPQMYNFIL